MLGIHQISFRARERDTLKPRGVSCHFQILVHIYEGLQGHVVTYGCDVVTYGCRQSVCVPESSKIHFDLCIDLQALMGFKDRDHAFTHCQQRLQSGLMTSPRKRLQSRTLFQPEIEEDQLRHAAETHSNRELTSMKVVQTSKVKTAVMLRCNCLLTRQVSNFQR